MAEPVNEPQTEIVRINFPSRPLAYDSTRKSTGATLTPSVFRPLPVIPFVRKTRAATIAPEIPKAVNLPRPPTTTLGPQTALAGAGARATSLDYPDFPFQIGPEKKSARITTDAAVPVSIPRISAWALLAISILTLLIQIWNYFAA